MLVICMGGSYHFLQKAAEPSYGPGPDFLLIDGGADLAKLSPGLSAIKDLFWASGITLVLVGLTDYAWILAVIAAIYVAIDIYKKYIYPVIGGMGGSTGDSTSSAKQERAAQRSQRRKIKRMG